jgi:tetratricopeptide (TPR) repeat protein
LSLRSSLLGAQTKECWGWKRMCFSGGASDRVRSGFRDGYKDKLVLLRNDHEGSTAYRPRSRDAMSAGGDASGGQVAISRRMNDISPLGRQAIEHARRGEFDQALAIARQAIHERPADFGLRVFIAMLHVRRGELSQALPHLREAVEQSPTDAFVRSELIRVLIALGEVQEASTLLHQPGLPAPQSLRLRALLLHRTGEVAEAGKLYRQLVSADPSDFESWNGLGLCLLASGGPGSAIEAFNRALELKPDGASVLQKWAEAHVALGRGEEALRRLRAQAGAANAPIYLAIAHLESLLGRQTEALAALEEAVRLDGANAEALAALAEKLEQQNDTKRCEAILGQLAALPRPGERLPLLKARLAFRVSDFERALSLASDAPPSADVGTRAQLIGQSLDRLGDAAGAFDAFVQMNLEDSRTGSDVTATALATRADLDDQAKLLTSEWISSWPPASPPDRMPAFLVGFPRSGTTLLDTLLMGHPKIAVAEEEPMLIKVGEKLGDLARLADLPAADVEALREVYFEIAEQCVPDRGPRLLIDKNPLAMGSAPIIHRLFPDAPIIFMERHPYDVVLSCFMTRFQPTGVGTNFLSLENTALLYDRMMQLWTKSAELLPLKVHRVRYERLVDDLAGELRPLAAFLGQSWMPRLVDHRETARKRSFIKTPSYAQVTEPVTKKAVGRWERYRDQLEPVLPVLEPWARRLGYEC